jgi:predicted transposase YdaD
MELSDEERERLLEESREKARRDWAARMKGALEQRTIEIAASFKKAGISIDTIAENTGLSPNEVARL